MVHDFQIPMTDTMSDDRKYYIPHDAGITVLPSELKDTFAVHLPNGKYYLFPKSKFIEYFPTCVLTHILTSTEVKDVIELVNPAVTPEVLTFLQEVTADQEDIGYISTQFKTVLIAADRYLDTKLLASLGHEMEIYIESLGLETTTLYENYLTRISEELTIDGIAYIFSRVDASKISEDDQAYLSDVSNYSGQGITWGPQFIRLMLQRNVEPQAGNNIVFRRCLRDGHVNEARVLLQDGRILQNFNKAAMISLYIRRDGDIDLTFLDELLSIHKDDTKIEVLGLIKAAIDVVTTRNSIDIISHLIHGGIDFVSQNYGWYGVAIGQYSLPHINLCNFWLTRNDFEPSILGNMLLSLALMENEFNCATQIIAHPRFDPNALDDDMLYMDLNERKTHESNLNVVNILTLWVEHPRIRKDVSQVLSELSSLLQKIWKENTRVK